MPFEQCSKKLHFSYGMASLNSHISAKGFWQNDFPLTGPRWFDDANSLLTPGSMNKI